MSLTQFTSITGTCVPVPGPDMDTDRIIPARFLKCITFDELAGVMFWDERFDENGQSKSHPVDDPRFKGASIILGGSNFGCGSSREHAPQTIRRSGIKAVIAESFAEIFFGNSTGIGLPCVCASAADIAALARRISDHPETEVTIDLLNMTASWKEGSFPIRMPAEAREALTRGRWDSIAELLVNIVEALGAHEHQHDGVLSNSVGVAGGRVDDGDVLGVGVVHIDVIEAGALLADDLQVLAGVHHLGGDGLGAAHDGVGLELGELLDVGLLVVVAAQLDFEVVGLEDLGSDLVQLDGVVNFELCHDKDLLSKI